MGPRCLQALRKAGVGRQLLFLVGSPQIQEGPPPPHGLPLASGRPTQTPPWPRPPRKQRAHRKHLEERAAGRGTSPLKEERVRRRSWAREELGVGVRVPGV